MCFTLTLASFKPIIRERGRTTERGLLSAWKCHRGPPDSTAKRRNDSMRNKPPKIFVTL